MVSSPMLDGVDVGLVWVECGPSAVQLDLILVRSGGDSGPDLVLGRS